jgi:hypothetical protein
VSLVAPDWKKLNKESFKLLGKARAKVGDGRSGHVKN